MEYLLCGSCDNNFRAEDVAPYQRNADGTLAVVCRKCFGDWFNLGILWPIPFWKRKEKPEAKLE